MEDLFIAHIAGMDTIARGLRNAAKIIEVILSAFDMCFFCKGLHVNELGNAVIEQDGSLDQLVRKRYQSFETELGAQIEASVLVT